MSLSLPLGLNQGPGADNEQSKVFFLVDNIQDLED